MGNISTKEQILYYLTHKADYSLAAPDKGTTSSISDELHISRSLTSQYVNELHKEGKLVKVSSRPVYYFSTQWLEEMNQIVIREFAFYDLEELKGYVIDRKATHLDFQNVIGSEGTLNYCTMQMKSAMMYPPNGLPLIVHGCKGSGKAYLVEVMYEFGKNQNLISPQAKFIQCNVANQVENSETIIFGSIKDGEIINGLIEKAQDGVLYLADAGKLTTSCQHQLTQYLKTGSYSRLRDEKQVFSKTRIVLGVEGELHDQLNDELILNIPIICEIPSLSSRSQGEKEEMIFHFLMSEAIRLNNQLIVSRALYQAFISFDFHDSIDEMHNVLRLLCANAYAQNDNDKKIKMYLRHLPIEVLEVLKLKSYPKDKEEFIPLEELRMQDGRHQILTLYEQILNAHESYLTCCFDEQEWLKISLGAMRNYYDFIVFEQCDDDIAMHTIATKMEEQLTDIEKHFQITLPLNYSFILARMVYAIYHMQKEVQLWEHLHKKTIHSCFSSLETMLPDVSVMATTIISRINRVMDVKLGAMNTIFLILNIHFYNRDIINLDTCGVIISHGYSTATSIADAANQMLQTQVFKAIDMSLDVSVEQIQKKLIRFIALHPYYHNLIILVDMGSLEDIASKIQTYMNIGVINNISTGLALDVGNRILRHQDLEVILKKACEGFECHYQLIAQSSKEKAIIFTNDVGIKVASKLIELFKNSLPKVINLKFIEYDYDRLQTSGNQDILFEKYDVILLMKPHQLHVEGIPCVSLEDVISFKSIQKVNEVLSEYLQEEELERFNKQLLKNFSLQSIMENLTILNPGKLLDQVSEAITQLQILMNRKFQSKTIIGIYMHTCFLIERLVTKTAILSDNMDAFEQQQTAFINHVHISFKKMLKNYSVTIPISEIAYLYDYIENEEGEVIE